MKNKQRALDYYRSGMELGQQRLQNQRSNVMQNFIQDCKNIKADQKVYSQERK